VKPLLLSGIAVVLLVLPATAGGEVPTEVQTEVPTEAPNTRPPVSSFKVPEQMSLCGDRVPLERMDVKERLEREFYYLLDRQGLLVTYIKRADRCNPIIEVILEMEELPEDLKYVPVAESELAFRATSSASAVGYWQFIEGTAKRYGLKVDGYIDERRDLTRSTMAAAAYLKDLHKMFGSWPLAFAGYNWGERNLRRAMKDKGATSYYDLYLPLETERYVFRILALKLIMEQPETYSIHVPEHERYRLPKVMEVDIASNTPISIDILAKCANVGARTIRGLNPWMRRNVLPAGRYVIAVPTENADGYADRVAKHLSKRRKVVHTIKRGENLSIIASKYNVTVESIEKWNKISRKKPIHFGQKLTIWQ
jgi:membrane-bound lytic murein transglycosylase D